MPKGSEINTGFQPIWDTMQLAVAAARTTYQFFSVPQGGALTAAVTKGQDEAFLHQVSMLDSHMEYQLQGISMHARPLASGGAAPSVADLQALQMGSIDLKFNNQPYRSIPNALIPAGPADLMYNDTATVHTQRGISAVSNIFDLRERITIGQGQNFNVDLHVTNIAAVTDVVIVLWGILSRPTI